MKKKNRIINSLSSFTLIELMIVLLIIGILMGIVMRNIGSQSSQARDTKRVGDLRNVSMYLVQYLSKTDTFPIVSNYTALETELKAKNVIATNLPYAPAGGSYKYYACSDTGDFSLINHYLLVATLEQDPTKNSQIYQNSWDSKGTSMTPDDTAWKCMLNAADPLSNNTCNKAQKQFCIAE